MGFLLFLACGPDIRSVYDEARAHALTIASELPPTWEPDLVVAIGEDALSDVIALAGSEALEVHSTPLILDLPLGFAATLRPTLRIRSAEIDPGQGCESCIHFDLEVRGDVSWALGPIGGNFPAKVAVSGQLQLGVEEGTRIVARPFRIGKVDVNPGDLGSLRANPSVLLQEWVRDSLGPALPTILIADLSDLPIRLLRIRTGEHAIRVEVLTNVAGTRPAVVPDPTPDAVILGLSETALAGLLRREAFTRGAVEKGVVVDPHAVDVEGNTFHLDLRLWRLEGLGWWRDYDVAGTLALRDGKIAIEPTTVSEIASSPGADWADPLAALAQAQILSAIASNLERTLPASKQGLGGMRLRAVATGVRGVGETLLVDGQLRSSGKNE